MQYLGDLSHQQLIFLTTPPTVLAGLALNQPTGFETQEDHILVHEDSLQHQPLLLSLHRGGGYKVLDEGMCEFAHCEQQPIVGLELVLNPEGSHLVEAAAWGRWYLLRKRSSSCLSLMIVSSAARVVLRPFFLHEARMAYFQFGWLSSSSSIFSILIYLLP
jgi:hypothetical protein